MTESVIITPQAGLDADDNPLPAGAAFTLSAHVAPTATTVQPGADGDLDAIDFTVYLPLRVKIRAGWSRTISLLTDNFTITIRGQVCVGRAMEWDESGFGGVEVLAKAKTGAKL